MIRILRILRRAEARATLRRRRRFDAGFSLLEVMIVLAIIAAIGSGVGVFVFRTYTRAQVKIAKERIKEINQGVTTYMVDSNSCPKSLEELVSQKYVARGVAKDPWGKDYILRCPGTNDPEGADIVSSGPDKAEGTADDIKSWEQQ